MIYETDGRTMGRPAYPRKYLATPLEILTSAGSVGGAVRGAEQGTRRTSVGEAAAIAEALGRSLDELVKVSEAAAFQTPKMGRPRRADRP